ncbi:hypothetical protein ACIO93_11185 [Streptomyces sp. NPDC087903]|uniref:hypothetical protein n=1 Tax=Streptomyces sp. NPDC087903 TaxID=3365819 RepID=UPI003826A3E4
MRQQPARYRRVDLLAVDALGFLELDRRGVDLLIPVLAEREDRNSVAIGGGSSRVPRAVASGPRHP